MNKYIKKPQSSPSSKIKINIHSFELLNYPILCHTFDFSFEKRLTYKKTCGCWRAEEREKEVVALL